METMRHFEAVCFVFQGLFQGCKFFLEIYAEVCYTGMDIGGNVFKR